jgi:hypothetical protein
VATVGDQRQVRIGELVHREAALGQHGAAVMHLVDASGQVNAGAAIFVDADAERLTCHERFLRFLSKDRKYSGLSRSMADAG